MVRAVADGAPVEVSPELLASVAANRERVLEALLTARRPVYGVNTGMGRLAGTRLTEEQQSGHQARLLAGRAVGGPPWLPERDVRALLAVRLRDLLMPETGVSAEVVAYLVDRLNDGFCPAVPAGGLGSAGEIIPLSHAFQTLLGMGVVLEGGVETPAAEALAKRGVEPYVPGPKEGVALLQGSPMAVTHAVLRGAEALRAADLQLLCAAMAIDVLGAPRGGYRPALAGPDEVLAGVLGEVRELTDGGSERAELVQAPVSVRVGPQALAHTRRVLAELASAADAMLAAPTDSPAFVDGEFVSTAGFHAVALGLRMDSVTAALVHLGEIGVQRLHRLLDERFSGLPAQLAAEPGHAGLVPLHKRAAGELHALRRLAAPATLGSIDTSAGQEDVQAFAGAAGEQLRTAVEHLLAISACELIGYSQAHALRGLPGAPALRPAYRSVASLVPPVLADRPLAPDLRRLVAAVREGHLAYVEGRQGGLHGQGREGKG
ncbi:aromatic amino acid lyase [Amycolatopsis nigrescens]|uniref:aromatic amino acid lyase n=1 Tax=Amycolatopsis nigrescens TaxID=381445 RepID=UPI00058F1539|nr:aromatic amino acid lyase [Amycolatopsis nigrescens]